MSMQRLTRNISKRIQRVLEEIAERLAHPHQLQPVPIPVRVPVPVRGRPRGPHGIPHRSNFACPGLQIRRFFCSFTGGNPNWTYHQMNSNFPGRGKTWFGKYNIFQRFYSFAGKRAVGGSRILQSLDHSFMFHNFSQAYQSNFRLKLYQQNVRLTYRTIFNRLREKYQIYGGLTQANVFAGTNHTFNYKQKFNPTIRLNLSLTPQHHKITLQLARSDSSATTQEKLECNQLNVGCYIDFPINFNLNIPQETILTEETFEEMMFNIKMFEQKLKDLKKDLTNLFELGELPIKYISDKNVLRIYFPNCDREKLENLCKEKNVTGGIIFEEDCENYPEPAMMMAPSSSGSVGESDILSCYYGTNESESSCESQSDLFSTSEEFHPLSEDDIVRPEFAMGTMPINMDPVISDCDEYYWISSSH
ncbi:uncharacterized protein SPAPADRAFT_60054 [Spathaspora passalidarum NRRL Y-27907]|uniref:Stationary phase protein 5 n=1 Tax=Spathaspora passalidarum (strain NRRL Y-27907 / 11-Y1) TaxID=619300 RepID=G3ALT7_SPAPN|nr:uncharacterized protein SPAPADRAFT_60054 [Spathaspora passalidarum NRRL Y-27907]EGW32696.1 hypothetical protein SPAPADRAFT_60054 [Spathaspora passalidarum NRRL Y-27907]